MSTAFTECSAQQGGHHHPELIIAEILDEDNSAVNDWRRWRIDDYNFRC